MKKLMILVALTCVGFTSFAKEGNEGPNAMPPIPRPTYVAKVVRTNGFVPPGSVTSVLIEIDVTGSVVAKSYTFNLPVKTEKLAQLSKSALKNLVDQVSDVQIGKIFDPNPSAPGCTDAGSTSYFVNQKGTDIEIALKVECKEMSRENSSYVDERIKGLLDAFLALAGS